MNWIQCCCTSENNAWSLTVWHKSASETVNSASPALQGCSLYTTITPQAQDLITSNTRSSPHHLPATQGHLHLIYQQHKVISTSSHTHPAFTINTWTSQISLHPLIPTFTSHLICWSCNLDFHRQHKDTTHSTLSVDPAILNFTVNIRTPHIPPYLLILWSWLSPSTQGHHTFHLICWSCDIYCDLHFHHQHKDTTHFALSLDPVTFVVHVFQIFIV